MFLHYYFMDNVTGGSLTKIAYYSTIPYRRVSYDKDSAEDAQNVRKFFLFSMQYFI